MLRTIKRLVAHVCTPDELDMIEHYSTRSERLADLWVHAVGLGFAALGGVVLAVLAMHYVGVGPAIDGIVPGPGHDAVPAAPGRDPPR